MNDLPHEVWVWVTQLWQLVPSRFVDWNGFGAMVLLCAPIATTCQAIFWITRLDANPDNEADPKRRRRIFSARRYTLLGVTAIVLAAVAHLFGLSAQYLPVGPNIGDGSGFGLFLLTVGEVSGTSAIGVKIVKPILSLLGSVLPRHPDRVRQSGEDREWVSDYF